MSDKPPIYSQSPNSQDQSRISITARITRSSWSLIGRTQGQRGAEMLAAIRALHDPTPEHAALVKRGAQMLMDMRVKDKSSIDFVIGRPKLFRALIEQTLATLDHPAVIVEFAAGLSPRGVILSREHPDWRVIEIDLPDVIREKQDRLNRAHIPVPPNLIMRDADLGAVPLSDVLKNDRADVVIAEGLLPYFPVADQQQVAKSVLEHLNPGGIFVFDLVWAQTLSEVGQDLGAVAKQQMGDFYSSQVSSEAEAEARFSGLGFASIIVVSALQLKANLHLDIPLTNAELFVIAHKGA